MLATVLSATLHGIDGRVIRVEVDVAPGLPGFAVVGLADASLQEARERVRGAFFPPRSRRYFNRQARRVSTGIS